MSDIIIAWQYSCSCGHKWVTYWNRYSQDECQKCGLYCYPSRECNERIPYTMNRQECLDKAAELINGDRARDYGDAYENHGRICEGWNIIVRAAMMDTGYLTPAHVALMMDWVKTSRLLETIDHADSWIDKAGYTALGAEFVARDKETPEQIMKRIREQNADNQNANTDVPTED